MKDLKYLGKINYSNNNLSVSSEEIISHIKLEIRRKARCWRTMHVILAT
jgi:hypothetical protein